MKFDTKQKLQQQLTGMLSSSERAGHFAGRLEEHVDGIAWETLPTHRGYWVSPRGTLLDFAGVDGKDPSESTLRLSGPWMEVGIDAGFHVRCADALDDARSYGAELERRVQAAHHALNGVI